MKKKTFPHRIFLRFSYCTRMMIQSVSLGHILLTVEDDVKNDRRRRHHHHHDNEDTEPSPNTKGDDMPTSITTTMIHPDKNDEDNDIIMEEDQCNNATDIDDPLEKDDGINVTVRVVEEGHDRNNQPAVDNEDDNDDNNTGSDENDIMRII